MTKPDKDLHPQPPFSPLQADPFFPIKIKAKVLIRGKEKKTAVTLKLKRDT